MKRLLPLRSLFAVALVGSSFVPAMATTLKHSEVVDRPDIIRYTKAPGNLFVLKAARMMASRNCDGRVVIREIRTGKSESTLQFRCTSNGYQVAVTFVDREGHLRPTSIRYTR